MCVCEYTLSLLRIQCYLLAIGFNITIYSVFFFRLVLQPGMFNSTVSIFHCPTPNDIFYVCALHETPPHDFSENWEERTITYSMKYFIRNLEPINACNKLYLFYSLKLLEGKDDFIFIVHMTESKTISVTCIGVQWIFAGWMDEIPYSRSGTWKFYFLLQSLFCCKLSET